MGVKGLWRLVAPVGKPVSLESLNGKILAVDVSIWLNKATKGMRDKHGNAIYNAHLVLMFHRICKLLFYGIKPVFVFDGGVPELKKKTLKYRRERRSRAETSKNKTKELMIKNYLQTKALEAITGAKSTSKLNLRDKKEKEDIFVLPEIPLNEKSQSDSSSDGELLNEDEWLQTLNESHVQAMFDRPDTVDIESAEFLSLPPEVKHELLTEIKDSQRKRYRRKDQKEIMLPDNAGDFSDFQLKNLMKRGQITQQIDGLRKEMNNSMTAQLVKLYDEEFDKNKYKNKHVEGKQYASNEKQSYLLIKNIKSKEECVIFKSTLEDDYIRFKQREVDGTNSELFHKLEREPAKFQVVTEQNAKRKRFASDSSDENELRTIKETYTKIISATEAVDKTESTGDREDLEQCKQEDVEFMSSSSSEEESDEAGGGGGESKGDNLKDVISISDGQLSNIDLQTITDGQLSNIDLQTITDGQLSNIDLQTISDGQLSNIDLQATETTNLRPEVEKSMEFSKQDTKIQKNIEAENGKELTNAQTKQIRTDLSCNQDGGVNLISDTAHLPVESSQEVCIDVESESKELHSPAMSSPASSTVSNLQSPPREEVPDIAHSSAGSSVKVSIDVDFPTSSNLQSPSELVSPTVHEESETTTNVKMKDDTIVVDEQQPCSSKQSTEELAAIQRDLAREQQRLEADTRKQTRQAATLSNETYQDVQELLRLFAIPYLVSPGEAEAQCAQLDYSKLTDGSITDDSDIFLFGGNRVYKNIFNQKKFAEVFSAQDLEKTLHLTRDKLIALAFLTGSDYTKGVQGVGGVTAMEILHEFTKNKPKESLKYFKEWVAGKTKTFNPGSNLKNKLRAVELPRSFNSSAVWEAYLSPSVDTSDERFEWGNPDLDAIKEFANEKLGWLYSRTNEILKPVMESLKAKKERQKTLKAYFQPSFKSPDENVIGSKRLQKILDRISTDQPIDGNPSEGEKTFKSNTNSSNVGSKRRRTRNETETESYFHDNSIESDLLELDSAVTGPSSSSSGCKSTTTRSSSSATSNETSHGLSLFGEDLTPRSPEKRPRTSHSTDATISTVSSSAHVQAMKVANLIKAAEESLKPSSPYITMQNVNNLVRSRMMGKGGQMKRGGGKRRQQRTTTSLLEQATAAKSSVQSSESDSN